MAEKNASQSQQQDTTGKIPGANYIDEQLERARAIHAELSRLEGKGMEHASRTIDEGARMFKESLAYGMTLSAAWRNLALEAGRRSFDLMFAVRS